MVLKNYYFPKKKNLYLYVSDKQKEREYIMPTIDNAAIARQLGYSKEEMIAKFGKPGEKSPDEICATLGLSNDKRDEIFGSKPVGDSFESSSPSNNTDNDDDVDNTQKTKDDKYEKVANALGYDSLSVSAVMKYIENGNVTGKPEEVVPQVAKDIGLPQTFVSNVLKYLNNDSI